MLRSLSLSLSHLFGEYIQKARERAKEEHGGAMREVAIMKSGVSHSVCMRVESEATLNGTIKKAKASSLERKKPSFAHAY